MLLCTAFITCIFKKPQVAGKSEGLVEIKGEIYDTIGNQFSKPILTIKEKVWYKDSSVIEEVHSIKIITDTANITTQTIVLENYRFNDLRARMVYEYKNFADTARMIRKYSLNDTIQISGGWNFKFKRRLEYQGSPEYLTDTVVDQINYKRARLLTKAGNNPYFIDCYFRCDKKGTIFNYDPGLSKMIRCPLVKLFTFSNLKKTTPTSSENNSCLHRLWQSVL